MGFCDYTLVGSDNAADMTFSIMKKQVTQLTSALRARSNEYNTPGYVNVAMFISEILMKQVAHIRIFSQDEHKKLADGCLERLQLELDKKKNLDRSLQVELKEHFKNVKKLIQNVEKFRKAIK